jgi:hypothetical protein
MKLIIAKFGGNRINGSEVILVFFCKYQNGGHLVFQISNIMISGELLVVGAE